MRVSFSFKRNKIYLFKFIFLNLLRCQSGSAFYEDVDRCEVIRTTTQIITTAIIPTTVAITATASVVPGTTTGPAVLGTTTGPAITTPATP
jgi:hypothetical protein